MPCMDGVATIHALRAINPQIKIIAMTGLDGANQSTEEVRAQDFLIKPFTTQSLLATLHRLLKS